MNVTEIRHTPLSSYEPMAFRNAEVVAKTEVASTNDAIQTPSANWKNDILLDVISSLENNIQTDNTHPLSRADYMPIEDFAEALAELNFFDSELFREQASGAQANVSASVFSDLIEGGIGGGAKSNDLIEGGIADGAKSSDLIEGGIADGAKSSDLIEGGIADGAKSNDLIEGGIADGAKSNDLIEGGIADGAKSNGLIEGGIVDVNIIA